MIFLLFIGCGGNVSNPIAIKYEEDILKSCKGIEWELNEIENDISEKLGGREKTRDRNLAVLLLTGPIWLDSGYAQQEEIKAFKKRYNHLLKLGNDKKCNINKKPLPEVKPASETEQGDAF